jgi:hypothetical protein
MKVCVARYQHRYGTDLRAFDSEAAALAWRTELAKRWWENEFPLDVPPPDEVIGEKYFEKISERCSGDEGFSYQTVELERGDADTSERALAVPTIHCNGTSREALLEQLRNAAEAVGVAIHALEGASPNGRDYYPQGPHALRKARAEHEARCQALQRVCNELLQLAEAVDQAEGPRR